MPKYSLSVIFSALSLRTVFCIVYVSEFPKLSQLVGGQFGQNGQKLHGNYKIGIFGSKKWGDTRGQANFSGSGRIPQSPPARGNSVSMYEIKHQFILCTLLVISICLFNWDSFHARLNSHYEAWSYKKKKHKKIEAYTGNLFKKTLSLKGVC